MYRNNSDTTLSQVRTNICILPLQLNIHIDMRPLTSVEAGHPLDLPDVGDLLAEQVGEHSDWNLHFAGVVESVVGLEHLGQVAGHAVRDEHDGLVATVAALATSAITILRPDHCIYYLERKLVSKQR
jgi:hypothetical protein